MSIRNKTKRRLTVLLAVLLATAAAVGGGVYYLSNKRIEEARVHREQGIAATKEHRYAEALPHLGKAWSRYREDPELYYHFAVARRAIPLPNGRHYDESIGYLDRAVKLKPDYTEAYHDLLQIYVGLRRDTEALELADRVLAGNPADYEAIRAKAISLISVRKPEKAVEVLEKGIKLLPQEARLYRLMLNAMREMKQPPEAILAFAAQARDAHPDDPSFELIWAYAHGVVGDVSKAAQIAAPLVDRDAPNVDYARMLVDMLDGVGKFDLSMKVLERNCVQLNDTPLREEWVHRLWQSNRFDDVLKNLEGLDPASGATSVDLVAIKALSLARKGRGEEARPLIEALGKRSEDPKAAAWAPVLRQFLNEGKDSKPADELALLRDADIKSPSNPYLLYYLGEAAVRVGENEAALQYWGRVIGSGNSLGLAPVWFLPHLRIAQISSELGQHQEAVKASQQALMRAPQFLPVQLARIGVIHNAIEAGLGNAQLTQALLDTLEKYHEQVPDDPQTLPIYIDLLARTSQRDRAVEALTAALDQAEKLTEPTLLRLADVSAEHGLGLEDRVFGSLEDAGATPASATAHAEHLLETSGREAAVRHIESAMAAAGVKRTELPWRVAHARVLDLAADPRAGGLWVKLVDENAGNLAVQRLALDARCLRSDRPAMSRIVGRIKAATGDNGLTWRLAEARSLLHEDASDADLLRASNSLKDVLRVAPTLDDARVLLADAQRRLGAPAEAIDQLAQVVASRPDNAVIRLVLAQMRIEQGDFAGARETVGPLSADDLSDPQVVQLASILSTLGEGANAEKLLEAAAAQSPDHPQIGLLLAQTYLRGNRPAEAEEVLKKLMAHPSRPVVAGYADFLISTDRYDEAVAVIAKLDELGLPPYEREMTLFEFHRRTMDRGEVGAKVQTMVAHLRAAAQAEPLKPFPRRMLLGFYIEQNRIDEAMKAAEEGHAALPQDAVFSLFHAEPELMRMALADPLLRPVAEDALTDDRHRDAALEAMRIVRDAKQKKEDPTAVARKLRQLAERFPRFLGAQNLLADWYIAHQRLEEAAEVASRTMIAFPNKPNPAERTTRIYEALRRWDEVFQPAREWRLRNPAEAREADLFIARAYFNQGQPAKTIETLDPYRSDLASPDKNPEVVKMFTAALVASNKPPEAAKILKPLLTESAQWRGYWLTLAATVIRDPATSKAWIEQVEPLIPADAELERISLAEAWQSVGTRSKSSADWDRALATLRVMAERPEAKPVVLTAYAMLLGQKAADASPDPALAATVQDLRGKSETYYRLALEKEPGNLLALNNLAMVLAERPESLDEALKLARKAVELHPHRAPILDTLAFVESNRKDYSAAARNLERAVELEPDTVDWRINLGLAYLRGGDLRQAQKSLAEVDKRITRPESLNPEARKHYDELKAGVQSGPEASAKP